MWAIFSTTRFFGSSPFSIMPELLAGPLEKTSLTYTVPACTLIAMPSDPRSLVRYTVNIREYGSLRGNNYTLARDVKRTPALGGPGGGCGLCWYWAQHVLSCSVLNKMLFYRLKARVTLILNKDLLCQGDKNTNCPFWYNNQLLPLTYESLDTNMI